MSSPFAYTAKLNECGSIHMALYLAIREAITEGKLSSGERLPSTRKLADLYQISRGSVSVAYEMLTAEGFVQAGVGQGTFVARCEEEEYRVRTEPINPSLVAPVLTKWGSRLLAQQVANPMIQDSVMAIPSEQLSFVPEGVGTGWFPWMEWKAEVAQQWRNFGTAHKNSSHATEGSLLLRQAIASRLRRERGFTCDAEEIIITAGSMQAITLLTQLLIEEGKTVVIENPCYPGIQHAVNATGASVITQPIDGNGIVPQDWDAQLLFVTPARQFPTGVVLSYERRRALLSWASRRNAWIIEDDYDSDFRWGGRPIEPLKALDREGRVIYIGSFSRSMSVGIRIGYAVVPRPLIKPFLFAKKLYDPYPTGIAEQQALASWMSGGGYDRYMRRMRRIYGKLENKLRLGLQRELGGLFEVIPSDAGLHVYAKWTKTNEEYEQLVQECSRRGVTWRDGAVYDIRQRNTTSPVKPSAVFGFAHLNVEQIEYGITLISQCAQSLGWMDFNQGQGGTVHA